MWANSYLAMTTLKCQKVMKNKTRLLGVQVLLEKIGCFMYIRPFGGSDVAGMRTNAVKKRRQIRNKWFKLLLQTGYTDYYIVAAKTNPELGNKELASLMDSS
jgi:alkylation response protein AidB-like acyl-CoA dehydrogenase